MSFQDPTTARTTKAHQEASSFRFQEFSVTELTKALGCPRAHEMEVTRALIDLCKTAVIRFGIPVAAHRTISELTGAPNIPTLLFKHSDVPLDPRWERLAGSVIPPAEGGFPIATLKAPSRSALEGLKGAVETLVADLKELGLKPISDITASALKDSIHTVREQAHETPDLRENGLNALRQLKIYHEVGAEWARVTSLEHFFLTGCTLPDTSKSPGDAIQTHKDPQRALDRGDRSAPPSADLLKPVGLSWAWSEKRAAWEPAPKSSEFHNSTLFDFSSHYFEARLHDHGAPLLPQTRSFFETLRAIAKTEEKERHQNPEGASIRRRAAQNDALTALFSQ
jgi:hypothetical protein